VPAVMTDRSVHDPFLYYTREELAAIAPKDGIDPKKRSQYRQLYCEFIKAASTQLKQTAMVSASAMIFCHRFFMVNPHNDKDNDYKIIASACLVLAGKTDECPRSIKDVIYITYKLRNRKDPQGAEKRLQQQPDLYEAEKARVLDAEFRVLSCINYQFTVSQPYNYAMRYARELLEGRNDIPPFLKSGLKLDPKKVLTEKEKQEKQKFLQQWLQTTFNFINDSLFTTLSLQYQATKLAAAMISLSAQFLKFPLGPVDGENGWGKKINSDITQAELQDVSKQVMVLYERTPAKGSSSAKNAAQTSSTNASPAGQGPDMKSETAAPVKPSSSKGGGEDKLQKHSSTASSKEKPSMEKQSASEAGCDTDGGQGEDVKPHRSKEEDKDSSGVKHSPEQQPPQQPPQPPQPSDVAPTTHLDKDGASDVKVETSHSKVESSQSKETSQSKENGEVSPEPGEVAPQHPSSKDDIGGCEEVKDVGGEQQEKQHVVEKKDEERNVSGDAQLSPRQRNNKRGRSPHDDDETRHLSPKQDPSSDPKPDDQPDGKTAKVLKVGSPQDALKHVQVPSNGDAIGRSQTY